jgi:hypothetical protein
MDTAPVIEWLLDEQHSDPSIRWQVMRDLLNVPDTGWARERARVESEGWGARLLSFQDGDGQWAGGAVFPAGFRWGEEVGQPWTATDPSLCQLRDFGIDPASNQMRHTVGLVGANCRWEHAGQPYWEGEVEPCINGRTVANGCYFGVDMMPLVARLAGERMEDGGWNCEAENGSVRSSFDTTVNVLEGLLEYERMTGGSPESRDARRTGEEYLLRRSLFRRLSTGDPVDQMYLQLAYPTRWHFDVLRGLEYFRGVAELTGAGPDPRLAEAVEYLRSRQVDDGTWALDVRHAGRVWFELDDGPERPSRWITLRALRVLAWWDTA